MIHPDRWPALYEAARQETAAAYVSRDLHRKLLNEVLDAVALLFASATPDGDYMRLDKEEMAGLLAAFDCARELAP